MKTVYQIGIAVAAILPLGAGATLAQPIKSSNCTQVAPVCAVKAGTKQSYWNACHRDGAIVLLTGECPATPNSEGGGGGGGSGGM
jgi:hypothetical protein